MNMEKKVTETSKLLDSHKPLEERVPIQIMFTFVASYDIIIAWIGFFCISLFSLSPIILVLDFGELIVTIQENLEDPKNFYEAQKNLAYLNYIFAVITAFIGWIGVGCFLKLGSRQSLSWKQAYFRAILKKPIKWFDKQNPASLSNSIESDCKILEHAFGDKLYQFISSIVFFIGSWVICFYFSIEISFIFFAKLPLQYVSYKIIQLTQREVIKSTQEAYESAKAIAAESLASIKAINSCNAQQRKAKDYQTALQPPQRSMRIIAMGFGLGWGLLFFLFILFTGIAYCFTAVLMEESYESWTGKAIGAKAVFIILLLSELSSFYLFTSWPCLDYLQAGKTTAWKINKIIASARKKHGHKKPLELAGAISFEKVYFSYGNNNNVQALQGASFEIAAGECIALVGCAGSGKTSILQLIQGLYFCALGTVKIDGVDIKEYDLPALRGSISVISQEPIIFAGSIKENVVIGRENASEAEIMAALLEVEAIDLIGRSLEKDMTVNSENELTREQKQRISMARAIIKKPRILLLDDPLGGLDSDAENRIQNTIEKIMVGTTTVLTSQSLRMAKLANTVVMLHRGKVLDASTSVDFSSKEGHFKRLLVPQSNNNEETPLIDIPLPCETTQEVMKSTGIPCPGESIHIFIRVLAMLMSYRFWLLVSLTSAVCVGATAPVFSYILVLDTSILIGLDSTDKTDRTFEHFLYLVIVALSVLTGLTIMTSSLVKIVNLCTSELRYKTFHSLLHFDMRFYDKAKALSGGLSRVLEDNCRAVSLAAPVLAIYAIAISTIIGGIVIGMLHDISITVVILAFVVGIMLPVHTVYSCMAEDKKKEKFLQYQEMVLSTLKNIKTVQCFNREQYFYDQHLELSQSTTSLLDIIAAGLVVALRHFLVFTLLGTVAWIGGSRVLQGELQQYNMLTSLFCVGLSCVGFILMDCLSPHLSSIISSAKPLLKILDYPPVINSSSPEGYYGPVEGFIKFTRVYFKYETGAGNILNCMSFCIRPGSSLGITGTAGCGKSTIAHLLLRFYDPSAGVIYLDSMPLKNYNIRHLRNLIGWVGEDPMLFRGSILHNIQLAMPRATEEDAIEALKHAQAADILEVYGMDFEVGTAGEYLSKGQRQRVAIARALIRGPRVLILDEATSALDSGTEARLMKFILDAKITAIKIAQKQQNVKNCEQIIVIEKGIIREKGSHSDLMKIDNGYYRSGL